MLPEWTLLTITFQALRGRIDRARQHPEAGITTTEAVVLIGVLVSIAIAVGVALRGRIMDKAKSIPLG